MDPEFAKILMQFGGLGVLALFAWLLLKSVLKQQERLATLLDNHLTSLLSRQETMNSLLKGILDTLKDDARTFRKHEEHMDEKLNEIKCVNAECNKVVS